MGAHHEARLGTLTVTLRLVRPWWFTAALHAVAAGLALRAALRPDGMSDDEVEAICRRWADRLARHVKARAA